MGGWHRKVTSVLIYISHCPAQGILLNCTIDVSPLRLQKDLNKTNICARCLAQGGPG